METEKMAPLAFKVATFARLTELSVRFLKSEIYCGNLRAIKKGSVWLIPAAAAKDYLTPQAEQRDQHSESQTAGAAA
jgi:hypothetical protein